MKISVRVLDDGRIKIESDKIKRPRYFKYSKNAYDFSISLTETGKSQSSIKEEQKP